MTFSLSIILLNKFAYKNVILLVSFKNIRIYIIRCYIVSVIKKDNYSLLQHKSAIKKNDTQTRSARLNTNNDNNNNNIKKLQQNVLHHEKNIFMGEFFMRMRK